MPIDQWSQLDGHTDSQLVGSYIASKDVLP